MKYLNTYNESVKDLMKGKSDEEVFKSLGDLTPQEQLEKSIENDFVYGVKKSIENGANPSFFDNWAIKWASVYGYTDIVKILLQDKRVDPTINNNNCIRNATFNNHIETVKLLLNDPRVDPTASDDVLIRIASNSGYIDIVKLLLQDDRVDPTTHFNEAIESSIKEGHIEIAKLLLQDKRVRDKLTNNRIKEYEKQIGDLTESVKDLMKGKSDDEILNNLDNMSPYDILSKSCKIGYLNGVKLALERGVDPSTSENMAIITATEYGHTEVVKLLLQDPRVDPSDEGNLSIHLASHNGHFEVVKLLLQDPRVDPSDNNNYAIRWALSNNHLDVVKLLLQNKKVRNKLSPEKIKYFENRIKSLNESVRNLMKGKSDKEILKSFDSVDINKLLKLSYDNNFIDGVKLALEKGADPTSDNNNILKTAIRDNNVDMFKLLLDDPRVDPSFQENYVIRLACDKGNIEIVKLLLDDSRVDPSDGDNYAIETASYYGFIEIVKLLLDDPRVDPSDNDNVAIKYASINGHYEVVKLLLQDNRVRNKLSNKEIRKFKKQISELTESVRNLMKGKSNEELKQSLINRSVFDRLNIGIKMGIYTNDEIIELSEELPSIDVLFIGIENNLDWLVKYELNKSPININFTKYKQTTRTGLLGYITTSYKSLVKIFGKPNTSEWGQFWTLKDESGHIIRIYSDNTVSKVKKGNYEWHIGGSFETYTDKEIYKKLRVYIYLKENNLI